MPGLRHGYPDLTSVKKNASQAHLRPAERAFFEQFFLGRRQENSLTPFIPSHVMDLGRRPIRARFDLSETDRRSNIFFLKHNFVDPRFTPVGLCSNLADYRGESCWLGLDCSSTRDLTGLVACFRRGDEFHVKSWAFCPGENIQIRSERDKVPYAFWAEEGHLIPAGQSAIDYSVILAKIRELIAMFDVQEVACDIKFAQPIVGPLLEDGVDVIALQQGWMTQSPALNVLEKAAYDENLKWDSPVLAWCMDNVSVHQVDSSGNRLMHKGRSRDRIDLASALWMAVSRAAAGGSSHWLNDPNFNAAKFLAGI